MIKDNISKLKQRIFLVCGHIRKDPALIAIVAVSKGRTPEEIKEVIAAGIRDIGENRVQEATLKYQHLTPNTDNLTPKTWHMVGHLQTNKTRLALEIFDLIHSVDSLHLARQINLEASRMNKVQDILLEVKTSPEESKFGFRPEETAEAISEIAGLKHIAVKGLMTIAPLVDDPEKTRPYFRLLKELKEQFNHLANNQLNILSMGMSDDFEVAIEEGATMLRIGRAIFGER